MAPVEVERRYLPSGCMMSTLTITGCSSAAVKRARIKNVKRRPGIWDSSQVIEKKVNRHREVLEAIGPDAVQLGPPYHEELSELNKNHNGDYIRLLKVHGVSENAVLCDLRVFSQQDAPRYAAISYCWGNEERNKYAIFTKLESSKPLLPNGALKITIHLHAGLRSLMHFNRLGWLWNDAICINQQSDMEKNDQVSRMKDIYSQAERTYVWLGKDVAHEYSGKVPEIDPLRVQSSTLRDVSRAPMASFTAADQGTSVWWKRHWVIQEFATCKNVAVTFGDKIAGWYAFRSLLGHCDSNDEHRMDGPQLLAQDVDLCGSFELSLADQYEMTGAYDHITMLLRMATITKELMHIRHDYIRSEHLGLDTLDLLYRTAILESGVSNPLDRVFSLLGLSTHEARTAIPVKYEAPLASVFANVVQFALNTRRSLEYLLMLWPHGNGIQATSFAHETTTRDLPTWIPDFTSRPHSTSHLTLANRGTFHASGDTSMAYEINNHAYNLRLSGITCGTVQRSYTVDIGQDLKHSDVVNMNQMKGNLRATEVIDNSRQNVIPSKSIPSTFAFAQDWSKSTAQSTEIFCTNLGLMGCALSKKLREGHEFILSPGSNMPRTPRLWRSGKLQKGDEIIVPLGFNVPWIIRPWRGDPEATGTQKVFSLVCECYVDGVMSGQLIDLWRAGKAEAKTYEIR